MHYLHFKMCYLHSEKHYLHFKIHPSEKLLKVKNVKVRTARRTLRGAKRRIF